MKNLPFKIVFQSSFEQVEGNFLVLAKDREDAIERTNAWITTLDPAMLNYFVGYKDFLIIDAYPYPITEQGILIV